MKLSTLLLYAGSTSIISAHIIAAPVHAVKRNIESKPRAMRAREEQLRRRLERRSRSQKVLGHEASSLLDYDSLEGCGIRGCEGPVNNDQSRRLLDNQPDEDDWRLTDPGFKLPVMDVVEASQITEISIGTPPQKIRVIISITDNDLFIPSSRCEAGLCKDRLTLSSSLSSSYTTNDSRIWSRYLRLDGYSILSKDSVHLAGLDIVEQSFEEGMDCNYLDRTFPPDEGWDGYLGLARSSNGSKSGIPSIYQTMISRGVLDQNIFSMKLSRGPEDPGEIMFGGINHDLYTGSLKSLPLIADSDEFKDFKGCWNVPMTSISLGGVEVVLENYITNFDSDFPFISLPSDKVMILNHYMGAEVRGLELPSIDCARLDELEDVTIRLGEHDFVISSYEYTYRVYLPNWDGMRCVSAFFDVRFLTDESVVVLGTAFLRNFYGVFDSEAGTVSLGELVAREKTR